MHLRKHFSVLTAIKLQKNYADDILFKHIGPKQVSTLPVTDAVNSIIITASKLLNATLEALVQTHSEMDVLPSQLPEY